MDTFPFPILVAGPGPGPAPESINHCPCGIHRADCTYHAETKPKVYHVRAKGWYTNYVWRTSYIDYTLESAQATVRRFQEMNDSGTYGGPNAWIGNQLRDMVFEVVQ